MAARLRTARALLAGAWLLVAGAAHAGNWPAVTLHDLWAMHDLIRNNHPGAADPNDTRFRNWLEQGVIELRPAAKAAHSLHDYQTTLRTYANGFADGHLSVAFTDPETHVWPGFLVRADAPGGPVRVSVTDDGPDGLHDGDIITACGGIPIAQVLEQHVIRPFLNPHVPQRLRLLSSQLMVADADDPGGQWQTCIAGRGRVIHLRWRPIAEDVLAQAKMRSSGIDIPPIGMRRIGDVWLISMPTFFPHEDGELRQWQSLVADAGKNAAALHAARHVVLDVRGNTGGDDAWGMQVAAALWGQNAVDAVERSMPAVIDWRVSVDNEAAIRADVTAMRAQGQSHDADYFEDLARRMATSLRGHDVFMREAGDPAQPKPPLASPFRHRAYVLTTPHCASACLDFVDLMNGLPGTARVGLQTSSDTDYLEIAPALLPGGHATLRYAMKVYRARQRGVNVSYQPAIPWPGGAMTDAAIARWVDALP